MKWTIRNKVNVIVFVCIVIMTVVLTITNYSSTKNNLLESLETKLGSDLRFSQQYIEKVYPGDWAIVNGELHKGDVNLVNNTEIVDLMKEVTGGNAASIFQGDTRISTNIIENGERLVGTKVSTEVADVVLTKQQTFTGIADVLGEEHEAVYAPIIDQSGAVIGVVNRCTNSTIYRNCQK